MNPENTASSTETTSTASDAVNRLVALNAEKAALLAKMEAIAAEETALKEKETADMVAKIDSLPAVLGVKDLDETVAFIRMRQKGTLGKLSTAANDAVRSRVVLTDEQRNKVIDRLKLGGAGNQLSELATEFGVSTQTIFNIKKGAGLVVARSA